MKRNGFIVAAVLVVFAMGILVLTRLSTPDNPRVAGRRLSAWFRDITRDPMAEAVGQTYQGPEVGMAVDVFRSQGSNAVRFLVGELVRSEEDSAVGEFLDEVNNQLPRSLRLPWVERRTRKETALKVLAQLDLRLSDLTPVLSPFLQSSQSVVQAVAIRSLGCVRRDPGEAAMALRPYAGSTNSMEVLGALRALVGLGSAATNAIDEILRIKASPARYAEINPLLGACGPAAASALPVLEDEWNVAKDKWGRLRLAITLCRVRPKHPEAWAFLESVARGQETKVPFRIHPTDLVQALRSIPVGDAQFTSLLLEMGKSQVDEARTRTGEIMDALNRNDPAAADRYVRELMDSVGSTNRSLRTRLAYQLLRVQPTNAMARAEMLRVAESKDDRNRARSAVQVLALVEDPPDGIRRLLETMIDDPAQHPELRAEMLRWLKRIRLREELKAARPRP